MGSFPNDCCVLEKLSENSEEAFLLGEKEGQNDGPLQADACCSKCLYVLCVLAFLFALASFSIHSALGNSWNEGIANKLNEIVEGMSVLLPCVFLFVVIIFLELLIHAVPCLKFMKGSQWFRVVGFIAIFVPLAVEGWPLLAFSFDVILSTGMSGVDVHVLQAFAIFGAMFLGHHNEAVFLLLLFRSAHAIEDIAHAKAMSALEMLEQATPSHAWVLSSQYQPIKPLPLVKELMMLKEDLWEFSNVESVKVGQILRVKNGELVPLRGTVLSTSSDDHTVAHVTQAHVDGELTPRSVKANTGVASGSFLVDGGPIFLRVTHAEADGEIGRLKKLLAVAEDSKNNLQSVFETFGMVYSKLMIFIALGLVFWLPKLPKPWNVPMWGFRGSAYRALAFVVAGAPCALVLSTPVAYWSTYSTLLWRGVSLSEMSAVSRLNAVTDVVFDKTGTLTTNVTIDSVWGFDHLDFRHPSKMLPGSPQLQRLAVALYFLEEGVSGQQPHAMAALNWASSLLANSVKGATNGDQFHHIQGGKMTKSVGRLNGQLVTDKRRRGVQGRIFIGAAEYACAVGSIDYIASVVDLEIVKGIEMAFSRDTLRGLSGVALAPMDRKGESGKWEIYALAFKDQFRKGAAETVAKLQRLRKSIWILSGDQESRVKDIAYSLGVPESNVKFAYGPQEKFAFVQQMEMDGKRVAMVGDEINDAAAMKASTLGVAIGDSTSQLMLNADLAQVVLQRESGNGDDQGVLTRLPFAFQQAQRCHTIIIQNIAIAVFGLLVVAPASVCGRLPFWLTVLGHEGGTICVALNSIRLLAV